MKKVRTGIVGLGRMGRIHAEDVIYRIPEAELAAVCSTGAGNLDFLKSWELEGVYTNYLEMIQKADLDAVIIASSSAAHEQQIKEAMNAGLHVFVEKPMGVTVEECLRIEEVVAAHPELKFELGFMRRYDPSYAEAKRKIEAGEIGKPFLIKSTSNDPVADIEQFLAYAPRSAGPWLDMSVHDIDLALWYMEDEIDSIYAIGGGYLYPELETIKCADNACALVKFKNGGMAQIHIGYSSPHGYQIETEIFGALANLRISAIPAKDRIQTYGRNGVVVECESSFPVRFKEAFLLEKQEFYDCIINDRMPRCGARDGTRSTAAAIAATRAFETGEVIYLNN